MKTKEEIKDIAAFNRGYHGYIEMFTNDEEIISYINEVAEKYAEEKVTQTLEAINACLELTKKLKI